MDSGIKKSTLLELVRVSLAIAALIFTVSPSVFAESRLEEDGKTPIPMIDKPGKFAFNEQISFFDGDYGAENKKHTALTYFTQSIKYIQKDLGELSVSVPYVIRNGGGVTAGESTLVNAQGITRHATGIGDVQLKGRYYWLPESDYMPIVDLTARVKFPTASHDKGLGTGRFDYAAGPSLLKQFGKYIALTDFEVMVRQRRHGSTLKPIVFNYSVGAGYTFSDKFSSYVFVEGSSKTDRTLKAAKNPLEVVVAAVYKPQKTYSINGYVLKGLSDGSPDIGGSLGFTRYF